MTDAKQSSLTEMSYEECLDVLRSHAVGRLGVIVGAGPAIFPVNYVLDGEHVVFRTDAGTKWANASFDRVAFEVDDIDEELREGVSVLVRGMGVDVTDAVDPASERARELPLHPWAPGPNRTGCASSGLPSPVAAW